MSGTINIVKATAVLFILLFTVTMAQEFNKTTTDEKTGKEILIGKCTREAFNDSLFSYWFNEEYEFHDLDTATLDDIKEDILTLDVTIIMGTWCSDSRREVPAFYKIIEYVNYPPDKVTLINVDRNKEAGDEDVTNFNVKLVPTFIFFEGKNEIGRIIESPEVTLEEDLANIIYSHLE